MGVKSTYHFLRRFGAKNRHTIFFRRNGGKKSHDQKPIITDNKITREVRNVLRYTVP